MTCVSCGRGRLRRFETELTREVAGRLFRAGISAKRCDACGEVFYPGPDLVAIERAIAVELSRTGPVNAAAFEFIRRAIPMAAKELAGLLGVAPETVSRREHDRSGLDRATWVTLGGLLADVIEVTHTTRDRRKENARQPQRWSTAYKLIW